MGPVGAGMKNVEVVLSLALRGARAECHLPSVVPATSRPAAPIPPAGRPLKVLDMGIPTAVERDVLLVHTTTAPTPAGPISTWQALGHGRRESSADAGRQSGIYPTKPWTDQEEG